MGHILVDLDGTLAEYSKFQGYDHIGEPIPAMLERVKRWLGEGKKVKIFTARASHENSQEAVALVEKWCEKHLGQKLEVTCIKDMHAYAIYDDRAYTVKRNTGEVFSFNWNLIGKNNFWSLFTPK